MLNVPVLKNCALKPPDFRITMGKNKNKFFYLKVFI